jgi:signal transduction histidine kinase
MMSMTEPHVVVTPDETVDAGAITVLLVEDNAADARLVREMLAHAGTVPFRVQHVLRLEEALLRSGEGGIAVILLDLSLPDAQGLEALHRLRAVTPDVPIVVMSASSDEALAVQGVRDGAQDYLVKGRVDTDLLVRALHYAIERQAAEDERRDLLAQTHAAQIEAAAAREADRLKSELLSTVSHELRTPLGAIKGFATGLLAHGERLSDRESYEAVQMIDEAADRLIELIDHLLQVQRLEAGRLDLRRDAVDVAALVRAVIAELAPTSAIHTLTVDFQDALPPIVGDERHVRQILLNLVGNAIKYSPQGGRVEVIAVRSPDGVELRVVDQGIGIPRAELERVFERFHRVDQSPTRRIYGTGLGLAIVKGVVEAQGGRVWAESTGPGQGSTFVVTLPVIDETTDSAGEPTSSGCPAIGAHNP